MYLIRLNEFQTRQTDELRSDSRFYGWIKEQHIDIFRFEGGQFEQMQIVEREREGSRCLYYTAEWHPVALDE